MTLVNIELMMMEIHDRHAVLGLPLTPVTGIIELHFQGANLKLDDPNRDYFPRTIILTSNSADHSSTLTPYFQSPDLVNGLSPQGQLPLGLALVGRSKSIADTLVDTGRADVNAVNGEVS